MARRSSRLQDGNYYAISNDASSSPVATVSYHETAVRYARKPHVRATTHSRLGPPSPRGLKPESGSTAETGCRSRVTDFFTRFRFSAPHSDAKETSGRQTKKACALLLLLLALAPFCIWFLAPLLTLTSPNVPVSSGSPQSSGMNLSPTYEKMYQEMLERNRVTEQAARSHLEHKISALAKRALGFRTLITGLGSRVRSLEAQNLRRTKELEELQQRPANSVTPELQKDIESLVRTFAERLGVRAGRDDCSECRRPAADRMADFALETQGASVISSRCSQTYTPPSARLTLFGIPLWPLFRSPRSAIQGSPILAGTCWSFVGSEGTLAVRLSHPVKITHVTVDHLPRDNSPSGDTTSAPKDFEVYGMKTQEGEGMSLGRFRYDKLGEPTQTFSLPSPREQIFDAVELRVLSNWGQTDYTCLYRFRVHGRTDVS